MTTTAAFGSAFGTAAFGAATFGAAAIGAFGAALAVALDVALE